MKSPKVEAKTLPPLRQRLSLFEETIEQITNRRIEEEKSMAYLLQKKSSSATSLAPAAAADTPAVAEPEPEPEQPEPTPSKAETSQPAAAAISSPCSTAPNSSASSPASASSSPTEEEGGGGGKEAPQPAASPPSVIVPAAAADVPVEDPSDAWLAKSLSRHNLPLPAATARGLHGVSFRTVLRVLQPRISGCILGS